MIDIEERILAVRDGATFLRPETEAVGLVIVELLRPVTYEPLPWPMVDALRALSHRGPPVSFDPPAAPWAENPAWCEEAERHQACGPVS
jgi:hypothetical protein